MNDYLSQPVIALITAMILTECTEISPWLARRILRTAARRIGNQEAAERYEEEWLSLLEERPGKILKLFSAAWIALRATWTLRAIHHSQGPTTAGLANGLVSWLIRPHHSRITVPEGYALASGGHSRWTVREGRANRNPSHLRLLVCLSVPQLLAPSTSCWPALERFPV
ncbi:hypothetical protein AB0890_32705 [Streptomyces sp. NPDC005406]|uniref:hypothetical protein n=1 Tax=Streptomyces sp. NPDC005406 TaxID=3155339 RepID=UPI0034513026